MKYNLKVTFCHISINFCDYWLLLFEWNEQFFVNIFLLFDLCIVSCIFNLFIEALHWIFEMLYEWNVMHYLDDFLFIFFLYIEIFIISAQFDIILDEFSLTKVIEKNLNDCIIIHLGFEFDSKMMQVYLSLNKKQYALDDITNLLLSFTIMLLMLERILDFLSHYC